MSDYWPGWLEYSHQVQCALVNAESKRLNREPEEADALMRRLARQRITFILNRLMRR